MLHLVPHCSGSYFRDEEVNPYEKDYQHSDWYRVLSRSLGSEDFGCRFVKYNYTEMINGCSVLLYGSTGEEMYEIEVVGDIEFVLD